MNDKELLDLGERVIRLRYSFDSSHLTALFREISISDYLILSNLSHRMGIHEPEAKIYLSEISKELGRPMDQISRMVQNLQNKGYIYWTHDNRGTYIYLSETGREMMKRQQDTLSIFFRNVINKMGREEFTKCMDQMRLLEQVMDSEAEHLSEIMTEKQEKEE